MNEQEFLQRFEHKTFNYQVKLDNGNWVMVRMYPGGYLAVTFARDHTIKFSAPVGFYPEERYWEFDEQEQAIILKNLEQTRVVAKYLLPNKQDDYCFVLENAADPTKEYVTHLNYDFDEQDSSPSVLNSQRVIFLKDDLEDDETRTNIEQYSVDECCEIKYLYAKDEWDFVNEVWTAITDDFALKNIFVYFSGYPDTKQVLTDKLILSYQEDNDKFISGTKGDVIVVLSQLLIKHYHEQLTGTQELHTPVELLDQVIIS